LAIHSRKETPRVSKNVTRLQLDIFSAFYVLSLPLDDSKRSHDISETYGMCTQTEWMPLRDSILLVVLKKPLLELGVIVEKGFQRDFGVYLFIYFRFHSFFFL